LQCGPIAAAAAAAVPALFIVVSVYAVSVSEKWRWREKFPALLNPAGKKGITEFK